MTFGHTTTEGGRWSGYADPAADPAHAEAPASRPRRRWLRWHVALLVVAAIELLYCARGQSFFWDEWRFLSYDQHGPLWGLLEPYNGHWSTIPMLVYRGLRAMVGTTTYWPYISLLIAVHLTLVHLLWRLMQRVAVAPGVATALAAGFSVTVAGYENLFWAFQIGFVGSLVVGVVAVLLALPDAEQLGLRRVLVIVSLLTVNLATSGVSLVFAVVVPLLMVVRSRRAAAAAALVPLTVFGLWYSSVNHQMGPVAIAPPPTVVTAVTTILNGLSQIPFGLVGVAPFTLEGWGLAGAALGLVLLGLLVNAAALGTQAHRLRRPGVREAMVVAGGGVVFLVMTAATRNVGLGTVMPSRYGYILLALSLPVVGVAVTSWLGSPRWRGPVVLALAAAGLLNAALLPALAGPWRDRTAAYNGGLVVAADLVAHRAGFVNTPPLPGYVWQVTQADLLRWRSHGMLPRITPDQRAELTGRLMVGVRVAPTVGGRDCRREKEGSGTLVPATSARVAVVTVSGPAFVSLTLIDDRGQMSQPYLVPLYTAGAYSFDTRLSGGGVLSIVGLPADHSTWTLCS